ncbi:steroid 17-alpha-hydroxylase/17,20 lyase-like [Antedon mediterranea]|uniref:steroid 17-alpha-hydroxylase/17,20 lyase-like n=1 Tax=Antedon mediterranea TaxID=105859 RepID=UPI003AF55D41
MLDISSTQLIVGFVVLFISWLYMNVRRPSGMPPGPTPYPITGSMSVLMGNDPPQRAMKEMSKVYGDIFSIKVGSYWSVVLNTYELVQEALLTKVNDFSGRPPSFIFDWYTDGQKDIAVANPTPTWKYHRLLAHTSIRKFAAGEYLDNLHDEIRPELSKFIMSKMEKPFDPNEFIVPAIYYVIGSMCFGYKYELNDPRLVKYVDIAKKLNDSFDNGWTGDFIPWFKYIPNPYFYAFKKIGEAMFSYVLKEVKLHTDKFDPDAPANDLIDLLLKAQADAEAQGGVDEKKKLTDTHLKQIIIDLFTAGIDTQNTVLHWAIGCLADNPEVQDKIKQEIDDVIGDRPPRLSDRGKLPYTEATLMEVMRYRTPVPLALTHRAITDSSIGSYKVPEDTWVFINLWALHNDPKYWDNPDKFRPERFLDAKNAVKQRLPSFLPFSTGRRVCVGESLAKANSFMIFSWLVQNYKFVKPEDTKGPVAVHDKPRILTFAKDYKVKVELWK